jgi:hypothetical protein
MSKGWQLCEKVPKLWFGAAFPQFTRVGSGWVDEFVAKSPQLKLEQLN